jgi:hypothetical protein
MKLSARLLTVSCLLFCTEARSQTVQGSHVLVEGSLVSTTYERGNGKGKKAKTNKQTFWCIRADVVRKLDRGEPEPEALASGSNASDHTPEASDTAPF